MKQLIVTITLIILCNNLLHAQTSFSTKPESKDTITTLNDTIEMIKSGRSEIRMKYKKPDGTIMTIREKDELIRKFKSLSHVFTRDKEYSIVTLYTPETKYLYDSIGVEIKALADKRQHALFGLLNNPFQNMILTDLKGKKYDLVELTGKVIVLNFWFTHCGPCIQEMPFLNTIAKQYSESGVVFLAISYDNEETISEFLKETKYDYIQVSSLKATEAIGIYAWPTHIVIDKKGIVKFIQVGNENIKETLEANIKLALE